jgi:hypothetical protein
MPEQNPPPPSQSPRPPKRKARIDVPLDPQLLDEARKKAGKLPDPDPKKPSSPESKLRAAIRSFLRLWVEGELPDPDPETFEQEKKRAKKRSKKS